MIYGGEEKETSAVVQYKNYGVLWVATVKMEKSGWIWEMIWNLSQQKLLMGEGSKDQGKSQSQYSWMVLLRGSKAEKIFRGKESGVLFWACEYCNVYDNQGDTLDWQENT